MNRLIINKDLRLSSVVLFPNSIVRLRRDNDDDIMGIVDKHRIIVLSNTDIISPRNYCGYRVIECNTNYIIIEEVK